MKKYSLGAVARAGAWGAALGGIAGFALGLLVAPEEGETIRRRLGYQIDHLIAYLDRYVEQLTHSDSYGDHRLRREPLHPDARERAKRIKEDIDELMGELKRHSTAR